jgi:hypothetical protein
MSSQQTDLAEMTPVEIDTAEYEAYVKAADIEAKRQRVQRFIDIIDETEPGSYYSKLPERSPERRAELVAEAEEFQAAYARVYVDEILPREAEWERRGRWTRYYLVDNTNGHVHKDQDCKTCFPDTRYSWLVEQSGMTAEDLVELAGEKACTVCFPWAPVDVLKQKTRLESQERKAARLEREAKKAAAAAKKAAKAITNPDGSPLKIFKNHYPERQVMRGGKIVKTVPAHRTWRSWPRPSRTRRARPRRRSSRRPRRGQPAASPAQPRPLRAGPLVETSRRADHDHRPRGRPAGQAR